MDGVLLLSEKIHASAFEDVCKRNNLLFPPYAEIAGMRTDLAFNYILEKTPSVIKDTHLIQKLISEKKELARHRLEEKLPVAPAYEETIHALSKTHKLALATSSSHYNANLLLEKTKTKHLFSSVITGTDVNKAKPDPEIFLKTLERNSIAADDALVIEDSKNGIQAASAAGISSIGVVGLHDRSSLLKFGAFRTIDSLSELIDDTNIYTRSRITI